MDIIKNYLDNMFMNIPDSAEVVRAKSELLTMMEDKYNELKNEGKTENEAIGTVISEFGNLDELADELGIGTLLNKSDIGDESEKAASGRLIDNTSVDNYVKSTMKSSINIAIGVALCILSPITIIILGGLCECKMTSLTENQAAAIGVGVLLVFVIIAVSLFIFNGMRLSEYDYLKKDSFILDPDMEASLRQMRSDGRNTFAVKIIVGVALCIGGVIPLIITGEIYGEDDFKVILVVCLFLAMIAVAVFLFVSAGMKNEMYKVLLQEEEYAKRAKEESLTGKIATVYWPIVTCGYLIWSFITGSWNVSWIVWPVAGIMFGAIASVCSFIEKDKQ